MGSSLGGHSITIYQCLHDRDNNELYPGPAYYPLPAPGHTHHGQRPALLNTPQHQRG